MLVRRAILVGILIGHLFGWLGLPNMAVAQGQTVLISEVQMGGAGTGHASEEFIELYNPGTTPVGLSKWLVQYRSASAGNDCTKSWSTKATLSGTIPAHGYFLLAATGFMATADARFTAGLAQSAGALRLINDGSLAVDALAWGQSTPCGHGAGATAPLEGQSLERRAGIDEPTSGNGVDTGDNSADFLIRATPEPQLSSSPVEVPGTTDLAPSAAPVYLPLQINELLVDPVSPQTDDHDEFVEITNPNAEPVDTNGYQLKWSGHVYYLLHQIIPAGGMVTISSADTPISLANNGGSIELVDPLGQALDAPVTWPLAISGATWARADDGSWAWTTTPTPGAANVMTPLVRVSLPIGETGTSAATPGSYLPVSLTELLPDPAAPLTDDADEFVELFNPNTEPMNLRGYVIKSGTSLGNSAALGDIILAPGQYLAITSQATHLPLANGGGQVQVFDPTGAPASVSVDYAIAKSGQAYALFPEGWRWTTTATPNAANILTENANSITPSKAITAKSPTTPAKAKVAASAKPKVVAPKAAPKPKASAQPKAMKKPAKKSSSQLPLVAAAKTGGGQWLLILLAGLTIAYIIYEFRHDLRNLFQRSRRHPRIGPAPRPVPAPAAARLAPRRRINW